MFVIVTGSGNLSVFKRVARASPCRCRCQVLVCRYVHKAMYRISSGYIVHVLVCYFNPFMSHGSFQFPCKMPYSATIYP